MHLVRIVIQGSGLGLAGIADASGAMEGGGAIRSALVAAGNDHWCAGRVCHCGANGSEHHSGEAATAMAAHDDELGRRGAIEKVSGRLVVHHDAGDADVGVAFPPAGQALGQGFLSRRLQGPIFHARDMGHVGVAPGM